MLLKHRDIYTFAFTHALPALRGLAALRGLLVMPLGVRWPRSPVIQSTPSRGVVRPGRLRGFFWWVYSPRTLAVSVLAEARRLLSCEEGGHPEEGGRRKDDGPCC